MVKEIGGRWWFCCPQCGKKLHPLQPGAVCRGVLAQCRERRCGWSGEIVVERKKDISGNIRNEQY